MNRTIKELLNSKFRYNPRMWGVKFNACELEMESSKLVDATLLDCICIPN